MEGCLEGALEADCGADTADLIIVTIKVILLIVTIRIVIILLSVIKVILVM